MRRRISPYNGQQFVLNTNTLEVHDLDRETAFCRIDEIKPEHVYNCDSYMSALLYSAMLLRQNCNGCAYCMPEKDTD